MTDDISCPECGAVSAAGARICPGCGSGLPEVPLFDAPAERPTESLPAQPVLPPPAPSRSRQRRRLLKLAYFGTGAGVVLLAVALAVVLGELGGLVDEPSGTPGPAVAASPAGEQTPDPTLSPRPDDAAACEPQTIVAPEPGAWRMATRRGDLQLASQGGSTRLMIRIYSAGSTDGAAQVSVEQLPAAEVESRFGIAPPGDGDVALAITFSSEFRVSGRRYQLGRVGPVDGVLIVRGDDGIVGIVGTRGGGCFSLRAPAWEEGAAGRSAELIIDVER